MVGNVVLVYSSLLCVASLLDQAHTAGQRVSNSDISSTAQMLWNEDSNAATSSDYRLSIQRKITNYDNTRDLAKNRLFTSLDEQTLLRRRTYARFIALLNNYTPNAGSTEHTSNTEKAEENAFIDEIMNTQVMKRAWTFLKSKGYASSSSTAFKQQLRDIWFSMYSRAYGRTDSSGFEHVFVGEYSKDGNGVGGLHNWIQFYLLEKNRAIDYMGYRMQKGSNLIKMQFKWNGRGKDSGSMFVGTSPEFEIALYTICFLTRPNQTCQVRIDNYSVPIRTYDVSYIKNRRVMSTAFPAI